MSSLRFDSLRLVNFKSFRDEVEIKLLREPGLYYVTGVNKLEPELGANGVGKSTIWDALLWALWGSTGRDKRPSDSIEPWETEGRTRVEVSFWSGQQFCVVTRQRSPNSLSFGDGVSDPREIAQGEVPAILGMTEEMFRNSLVLSQFGELFLDMRAEAQSQMFTEALELNVWIAASDKAKEAYAADQDALRKAQADLLAIKGRAEESFRLAADAKDRAVRFQQDKNAAVVKLRKGHKTLTDAIQALVIKKPKQSKIVPNLSQLSGDHRVAEAEHHRAFAKYVQLKDMNSQNIVKYCPSCKQAVSEKQHDKHVKVAKELMHEALVVLDQATIALSKGMKAQDIQNVWMAWNQQIIALRQQAERTSKELDNKVAEKNEFAEQVKNLEARLGELDLKEKDLKESVENIEMDAAEDKYWVDAFKAIRLSIIDEAMVELEIAANRHAELLGLIGWKIEFATEKETKAGAIKTGFTITLYPPGQDRPVKWESYSGGEVQRWQLAVSFALSEVLLSRAGLNPNIEVLDEPTKGLSTQGVEDLLEHLRDRALELGRAIYFVDHHSLDKGAFDGTLVVTKSKAGSALAWQ